MSDGTSSRLASLLGLSGTTESRGESPAYRATLLLIRLVSYGNVRDEHCNSV